MPDDPPPVDFKKQVAERLRVVAPQWDGDGPGQDRDHAAQLREEAREIEADPNFSLGGAKQAERYERIRHTVTAKSEADERDARIAGEGRREGVSNNSSIAGSAEREKSPQHVRALKLNEGVDQALGVSARATLILKRWPKSKGRRLKKPPFSTLRGWLATDPHSP